MSLYTALCANVLFPVHEHLKGHNSVARRERLESSQWWPGTQLEIYRIGRLREFLSEIGQRIPYYREMFRHHHFNPQDVDSLNALQSLPLLTKSDIRANLDALKTQGPSSLMRYNTGGSSGEPLIFYMGKGRKSHDVAAKWRATRWWGVDIGDPELVVWGSPVELGAQDRIRRLRDGLMRSYLLPAFEMSSHNLAQFVKTIRSTPPAMLFGYPSSLALIAQHARHQGQDMTQLGIKVAFVTSEKLY